MNSYAVADQEQEVSFNGDHAKLITLPHLPVSIDPVTKSTCSEDLHRRIAQWCFATQLKHTQLRRSS